MAATVQVGSRSRRGPQRLPPDPLPQAAEGSRSVTGCASLVAAESGSTNSRNSQRSHQGRAAQRNDSGLSPTRTWPAVKCCHVQCDHRPRRRRARPVLSIRSRHVWTYNHNTKAGEDERQRNRPRLPTAVLAAEMPPMAARINPSDRVQARATILAFHAKGHLLDGRITNRRGSRHGCIVRETGGVSFQLAGLLPSTASWKLTPRKDRTVISRTPLLACLRCFTRTAPRRGRLLPSGDAPGRGPWSGRSFRASGPAGLGSNC